MKTVNLLSLLSLLAYHSFAVEYETLNIISFDGKREQVKITLDPVTNKIDIFLSSNLKEKTSLLGYVQLVEKMNVLDEKFLKIRYKILGGSGIKLQKTVLLCVSNGRLNRSLDFISYDSYVLDDPYSKVKDFDEINTNQFNIEAIITSGKDTYISATESFSRIFKSSPNHNILKKRKRKLYFDMNNYVFYDSLVSLKRSYYKNLEEIVGKHDIERVPYFYFEKDYVVDKYFFVKSSWYLLNPRNYLIKNE